MNEQLATAVANGATTDVLRRLALESGMKTLLGYSLELVRKGQTTLEEVGRMILTDSGLESERRARALSTVTCEGCGGGLQGRLAGMSVLSDAPSVRCPSWI